LNVATEVGLPKERQEEAVKRIGESSMVLHVTGFLGMDGSRLKLGDARRFGRTYLAQRNIETVTKHELLEGTWYAMPSRRGVSASFKLITKLVNTPGVWA